MVKMLLPRFGPVAGLITLLSLATMAAAQDVTYCASFNTADGSPTVDIYQSYGACHDNCNGKSAYAVLQDKNCWCTDYTPASSVRVSIDDCNTPCPGFPDNKCGGKGLWGYIQLGKQPAGTKGGTTPSSTSTPQAPVTETVQNTVTISSPATHDQNTTPTTQPVPVSEAPDSTTTKAPHDTPQPSTMVSTITQDGGTRLQTVTVFPSMPTTTSDNNKADAEGQGSGGMSAGAAAGVAVGVIGFFLILGGIAAFLWFRRRQNRQQTMMEHQNSVRGSSSGMMGTPRTDMASVWDGDSMGRRNSRFMPHDPRMDPFAPNIYGRFDNKSHESVNTLRDDQDYSRRVLRTTNPDPDNA